jgi:hypothetical protein
MSVHRWKSDFGSVSYNVVNKAGRTLYHLTTEKGKTR